ncbi:carbamoyl phosphate synthase-like protein [Jeotgalibaca caeni]|uniref:carboxylate--amine ligase n=1 Tax=Jeotgalibaca caeni TaxID=3028623 RepID=UPI00237EAB91|nr:carbamoyl phosphate synthase-like protein [Jeotgalibaca caeni]MDE1548262.1 carbamoyl phosphate synthase-like protein [Jeotgalibaca caeni]
MKKAENQPFVPVILGGNRGAYGLARAFYEAYGIKTHLISPFLTGPINRSTIIEHYLVPSMTDFHSFQKTMLQIENQYPDCQKLLFGSDDRYVEDLLRWRDTFPSHWVVPYVERETYEAVTNKVRFHELCEAVGVPHPRTVVLTKEDQDFTLPYPVIIKPADTPAYQRMDFAGKKKVYICLDEVEASRRIALIRQNGYQEDLIVQEYITGNDETLGVAMVYVAKYDRKVKLHSFANVLVDDPTPSAIGNSLASIVVEEEELTESIEKIFAATNFYGFATFDVKYDSRKQQYVFFELNARLGSSNYYVTAAGNNVAQLYVKDFLYQQELPEPAPQKTILYSSLPKSILLPRVESPRWKQKIKDAYQKGNVIHPLAASYEKSWRRKAYIALAGLNYCYKLWKFPSLEQSNQENQAREKEGPSFPSSLSYLQKNHHL